MHFSNERIYMYWSLNDIVWRHIKQIQQKLIKGYKKINILPSDQIWLTILISLIKKQIFANFYFKNILDLLNNTVKEKVMNMKKKKKSLNAN